METVLDYLTAYPVSVPIHLLLGIGVMIIGFAGVMATYRDYEHIVLRSGSQRVLSLVVGDVLAGFGFVVDWGLSANSQSAGATFIVPIVVCLIGAIILLDATIRQTYKVAPNKVSTRPFCDHVIEAAAGIQLLCLAVIYVSWFGLA